jgi:hypothetical protein
VLTSVHSVVLACALEQPRLKVWSSFSVRSRCLGNLAYGQYNVLTTRLCNFALRPIAAIGMSKDSKHGRRDCACPMLM